MLREDFFAPPPPHKWFKNLLDMCTFFSPKPYFSRPKSFFTKKIFYKKNFLVVKNRVWGKKLYTYIISNKIYGGGAGNKIFPANWCISTLKISGSKVDTRNEILGFFQFLFCLQNSKKHFDAIILLINILGDIRRSIKLPKNVLEGIRSNC